MPIAIHLEGDGAFSDLRDKQKGVDVIHLPHAKVEIAALPMGMQSGRPSCAFRIDLPDGRTVIAETSLRELIVAGRVFATRYFPDGLGED